MRGSNVVVALCGFMRNAACVTEHTVPQDPFAHDEDAIDVRIVDGRDTPLTLMVDADGKPMLLTSLSPIDAALVLINIASGILTGAVVPDNFPTGDQLREMLIEKSHEYGFSDEAVEEVLAHAADPEFHPGGLGEFFSEVARRDAERKKKK